MNAARRGFTLFELIVVLAVLVIAGALAAPSFRTSYTTFRLKSAADNIRAAWAKARSFAMNQACAYRFSIIPNTGSYRIGPDNPDAWTGTGSGQGPDSQPLNITDELPTGVTLGIGNTQVGTPSNPGLGGSTTVGTPDEGSYVVVAVFLPNGTAREDVQIVLTAKGVTPLSVKLRGLTGSVTTETLTPGAGNQP